MMQIIDGVQVSSARGRMGEKLAQRVLQEFGTTQLDIDVVMPVPETSRTAALACARILNRPYREVKSPSHPHVLDTLFSVQGSNLTFAHTHCIPVHTGLSEEPLHRPHLHHAGAGHATQDCPVEAELHQV